LPPPNNTEGTNEHTTVRRGVAAVVTRDDRKRLKELRAKVERMEELARIQAFHLQGALQAVRREKAALAEFQRQIQERA
jgi:hypothetical protein